MAITIAALGGPENLVLDDLPEPEAGPGDLLVEVARRESTMSTCTTAAVSMTSPSPSSRAWKEPAL